MKRFVLWGYKDICGKEIRCILKICSNEDYSYFMWCLKLIFCNLATVVLCKMSISVTWPWIINISLLPNFLNFVISSSAQRKTLGLLGFGEVFWKSSCFVVLSCNWVRSTEIKGLCKPSDANDVCPGIRFQRLLICFLIRPHILFLFLKHFNILCSSLILQFTDCFGRKITSYKNLLICFWKF